MKVLVDADACPKKVLNILIDLQKKYKYKLITISSFNHNISGPEHITVDNVSQAADIAVVNRTKEGDIIITADWGLASLVLSKKAKAISPSGKIFNSGNIDFMLEERHLKAKIRKSGGRTKGPAARTEKDDERFLKSFIKLLSY